MFLHRFTLFFYEEELLLQDTSEADKDGLGARSLQISCRFGMEGLAITTETFIFSDFNTQTKHCFEIKPSAEAEVH